MSPQPAPQTSVIIIFLNAERFIDEAIESVFAQTYRAWELLLVDDGSTDHSTVSARRYAELYPDKVRYLDHEGHLNWGMSASRNLGIRHARGEFIAFLDADDVWRANTLEEQVAILRRQPEAAMVYGPIQWWYSWTGATEDQQRDCVEQLGVPLNELIRPPRLLPLFLRDKAAVPSGLLVRREVVQRLGGFEEAFRGEYEDQVFCAKLCLHEAVFASEQSWYRYRQHPHSCVAVGQQTGQTYAARLTFLNWLAAYLAQQRVKDLDIWWALRVELWRCRYPFAVQLVAHGRYLAQRLSRSIDLKPNKSVEIAG